ncbi:PUA domain-containing protein [Plasmodiophora brassicae]|uniref:PUA domain-containing protein n=1 Tax=Plasmodiophora brassicae TaxID=37360 RepID=A0A0G4ILK1_PLABS|nr:hypothetical protein PBRA_004695 [Plasmodiophora brassicae]SPQ93450.1 unnamed protein product [Plasmodiophora brassicae]
MFKKFTRNDDVASYTQVKSSEARRIRKSISEQYPDYDEQFDAIFKKKAPMHVAKCHNHVQLIADENNVIWFFSYRKSEFIPTLRTLHRFPKMLPVLQVDRGAIKFVLSGANIMSPGLTSPGGRMDTDVDQDTVCAIYAEGKEHALAIGVTKMSTEKIRSENKGIAVDVLHHLNDGLWTMPSL